jgi:hypothetical protein
MVQGTMGVEGDLGKKGTLGVEGILEKEARLLGLEQRILGIKGIMGVEKGSLGEGRKGSCCCEERESSRPKSQSQDRGSSPCSLTCSCPQNSCVAMS